jgi:hypothetical protein
MRRSWFGLLAVVWLSFAGSARAAERVEKFQFRAEPVKRGQGVNRHTVRDLSTRLVPFKGRNLLVVETEAVDRSGKVHRWFTVPGFHLSSREGSAGKECDVGILGTTHPTLGENFREFREAKAAVQKQLGGEMSVVIWNEP